ncbi:MAG: hypothetical protein F6J98_46425 [Moorea sp. SIO4G2]|nr:hypothetical protein [Moorena sp. SIO4G2]
MYRFTYIDYITYTKSSNVSIQPSAVSRQPSAVSRQLIVFKSCSRSVRVALIAVC